APATRPSRSPSTPWGRLGHQPVWRLPPRALGDSREPSLDRGPPREIELRLMRERQVSAAGDVSDADRVAEEKRPGQELGVQTPQVLRQPTPQPVQHRTGRAPLEVDEVPEVCQREANAIGFPEEPFSRKRVALLRLAAQAAVLSRKVQQDSVR